MEAYLGGVLEEFEIDLSTAGFNPNNGLSDFYRAVEILNPEKQDAIQAKLKEQLEIRPSLAMVNSDKGITNLHVPSDIIIDASMPAMIRSSGRMWGPTAT